MNDIEEIVGSRTAPPSPALEPEQEPESDKRHKHRPPLTRKQITLRVLGVILLILTAVGVWFGQAMYSEVAKLFNKSGNGVFGLLANTKLKGQDAGRVNILLAGNSADDPGHGGGKLTDSIMILSINTQDHTAFMLSIPRDLWVNIPGRGYKRINTAYTDGGMELLDQILERDLGISLHYYALINYTAFRDAVNAVGGIDVTIQSSDPRGLYDANLTKAEGGPLKLTNGQHHLDGQTALNLARARGDLTPVNPRGYGFPRSDFDRTDHQRLMLSALATKASSAGVLTNPVKVLSLLKAAGNNVQTDFKTDEIQSLVGLVKQVNLANLQSLSFVDDDINLIADYRAPDGAQVLVPKAGPSNFGDIQRFIQKQTSNDAMVREEPSLVVLNGSAAAGLARTEADYWEAKGADILGVDNAPNGATLTNITDASGGKAPGTLTALLKRYGAKTPVTTVAKNTAYPSATFIVILGADRAPSPSPSTP